MTRSAKNIIYMLLVCVLLMAAGYGIGACAGRTVLTGLFSMKGSLLSMIYTPSAHYYESARLLNSENELDRIAGYYSLLDGTALDEEFLRHRFLKEGSVPARKVILWVLAQSVDSRAVFRVLEDIYDSADKGLQKKILAYMHETDARSCEQFMKKRGIENSPAPGDVHKGP